MSTLRKIVSGGQTGVDRGALDAALAAGFPCGGWCPAGRLAEDGALDSRYPLQELPGGDYAARTLRNVLDSDATLILHHGPMRGGTLQTWEFCRDHGKPVCCVDMAETGSEAAVQQARQFVERHRVGVLNVAGPRASQWPGGYDVARRVVGALVAER
ncbi:MAG: putative molybdenum carrier protein [Verrucomicrobiae bacterium]|nr:putative molybdenum carrier protein [Verrucomicrobiae bacterium]